MFRIDGFMVCDATKQGNVARFINASCDPNCYTQIITLNGSKRIVIYAKRDIKAGEELCYDYKFPFEFDQSKRIPCHCGAKECRGYMNWDKRYVVLPPANASNTGASGQENA
jgi:histone-lysine N-methyltransferase SETD1